MDRLHHPSNDRSSRWTLPTFIASKSYQALFGSGSGAPCTSGAGFPSCAVLTASCVWSTLNFHTNLHGAEGLANLLGAVNLGGVDDEVQDTAGVSPLVVVPGDQLDEVVVKGDTGLGVEDGRGGVTVQVRGDNVVLSVGEVA